MKFRKKHFWIKDNIYELSILDSRMKTLSEAVDKKIAKKPLFPSLNIKWPLNRYFNNKENFLIESESLDNLRIADSIYRELRKFIMNNVSEEERDIINFYKVYGDKASFTYDVDEKRNTSLPKVFTISTILGKLSFEISDVDNYGLDDDTLLAYDDEKDTVILFVVDKNRVIIEDIINILRKKYRFIHELTHYIFKMKGDSDKNKFVNDIEYLNSPEEVKANIQMLIYSFGSYLFKNSDLLQTYNLKSEKEIDFLFNKFLRDDSIKNIVDSEDLEMMRKEVYYMYPENREMLYDNLHKYITDEYGTSKDIDYKESSLKNNLIRLIRLEEKVINEI